VVMDEWFFSSSSVLAHRIRGWIFAVYVPRTSRIIEPIWGTIEKMLLGGVIAATFVVLSSSRAYEKVIPATGSLESFWADSSVALASMASASSSAYCTDPYNYSYPYCDHGTASATSNEFWCEDHIECLVVDPHHSVYKHSPNDMWAITYVKDKRTQAVACNATNPCTEERELFQQLSPSSCQCVKTSNYFLAGAEHVKVSFRPKLIVDGHCLTEEQSIVKSKLYVELPREVQSQEAGGEIESATGSCTSNVLRGEFAPGEQVAFSAAELLEWAGFPHGLETADAVVTDQYATDASGNPSLRITGISFEVRVLFTGSLYDQSRPIEANVHVTPIQGWHAIGSDMPITLDGSGESHDNYRRGVHVRVSFGGSVTNLDLVTAVTVVAAYSVFLGFISLVINYVVVTFLGYRSRVYKDVTSEKLTVDRIHQAKAAQAIVSAAAFMALDPSEGDGSEAPEAVRQAVETILEKVGLPKEQVAKIAQHALTRSGKGSSITFDDLADASSSTAPNIHIHDVAANTSNRRSLQRNSSFGRRLVAWAEHFEKGSTTKVVPTPAPAMGQAG